MPIRFFYFNKFTIGFFKKNPIIILYSVKYFLFNLKIKIIELRIIIKSGIAGPAISPIGKNKEPKRKILSE